MSHTATINSKTSFLVNSCDGCDGCGFGISGGQATTYIIGSDGTGGAGDNGLSWASSEITLSSSGTGGGASSTWTTYQPKKTPLQEFTERVWAEHDPTDDWDDE